MVFSVGPPTPHKKIGGHNRWLKMKLGRGFCHLFTPLVIMSSFVIFWLTPPASSGDDVIYEQPLREASSLLGNQWLEQFMTEQCYHRWYT